MSLNSDPMLRALYRRVWYWQPDRQRYVPIPTQERADWCDECGARHSPERRQAVLRRLLPARVSEIREAWPHLWPASKVWKRDHFAYESRMLFRDLQAIGATSSGGVWELREVVAA